MDDIGQEWITWESSQLDRGVGLVLQLCVHLFSPSTHSVVEVLGSGLMAPSPSRPGEHVIHRGRRVQQHVLEQTPYFGDTQGDELTFQH